MGHSIQAIIASSEVAEAIGNQYANLPRLSHHTGFVIFPVDDNFFDSVVSLRPSDLPDGTFLLLISGFQNFLRELSHFGPIAYVETDYFGGKGGQGAVVYAYGEELMPPKWSKGGTINAALAHIGVPKPFFRDRFAALGLMRFRSNDDLMFAVEIPSATH